MHKWLERNADKVERLADDEIVFQEAPDRDLSAYRDQSSVSCNSANELPTMSKESLLLAIGTMNEMSPALEASYVAFKLKDEYGTTLHEDVAALGREFNQHFFGEYFEEKQQSDAEHELLLAEFQKIDDEKEAAKDVERKLKADLLSAELLR